MQMLQKKDALPIFAAGQSPVEKAAKTGPSADTKEDESYTVVIDGEKLRVEEHLQAWNAITGNYAPSERIWCFVYGHSTVYFPLWKSGQIREGDESTRGLSSNLLVPIICAYRLFSDTLGQAKPDEVLFVGRAEEDGHACLIVEKKFEQLRGIRYRWYLATDQGYRPVHFQSMQQNAEVILDVHMRYAPDEKAGWRLVSWTSEWPHEKSRTESELTECRFNKPIEPVLFNLIFPNGTRVGYVNLGIDYTADNSLSRDEYIAMLQRKVAEKKALAAENMAKVTSRLKVGEAAPSFNVRNIAGGEVKLSDFIGKYLLLDFWATWCKPCREQVPYLKAVYDAFSNDKHFAMLSLSLDEAEAAPGKYAEENGVKWTQGFLGEWSKTALPLQYGTCWIPAIYLISPDGKVIARDLEGAAIKDAVADALRPR
jgi:thiol-disulfide isomerase/thioredoxin